MILKRGNKHIGKIDVEKNVFTKNVSARKHLFLQDDSWGIDYQVFEEELLPRDVFIVVYDRDSKNTYITTAAAYKQYGKTRAFGVFGKQIFMPRDRFIICPPGGTYLLNENMREAALL